MMKMKTVYLTLFVFLLGIAAGAVFFLNRRIPKEPTTYSNDSTSKWLDDRKKLSACEDNAAQLKKIAQSNQQQELAEKTDLEKQQAQLQAQASQLKPACAGYRPVKRPEQPRQSASFTGRGER